MYLRQNYHFGPHRIAMYLKRYHDITISPSGAWRILTSLGINRPPTSQRYKRHTKRWKRYEKPQPGHRVQVDVRFLGRQGTARTKYYQYIAIDDCTRAPALRIHDRYNRDTSIRFHYHVLDARVGHVPIKPATPRLNGKVERSHRIDQEEFYRMLEGVVIDDTHLFNDRLQQWEDFCHFNRPHGGFAGDTPYEKPRRKTTVPVKPPTVSCTTGQQITMAQSCGQCAEEPLTKGSP